MVEEVIFFNPEDTAILKKAIAKNLYSKNFSQIKISEILNISQPMVSYYCISDEKISEQMFDLAESISKKIIDKDSIKFNNCISFYKKISEGSKFIAEKNEIIDDKKIKIFDNLTEAFSILKGKDISKLIPAVKINIAMANDDALSSEDVASFLNGLIITDDKVTSNNGIRFGKSKHLSSLLINLKKSINTKAIMNIAYIKNIKKTNFNFDYLTKDFELVSKKKNIDILLHRGDFGIEPCTYVIGKDAVDVVNKILKIKDEI